MSTHLQRNPEDPAQDMLRARQAGNAERVGGVGVLVSLAVVYPSLFTSLFFWGGLSKEE